MSAEQAGRQDIELLPSEVDMLWLSAGDDKLRPLYFQLKADLVQKGIRVLHRTILPVSLQTSEEKRVVRHMPLDWVVGGSVITAVLTSQPGITPVQLGDFAQSMINAMCVARMIKSAEDVISILNDSGDIDKYTVRTGPIAVITSGVRLGGYPYSVLGRRSTISDSDAYEAMQEYVGFIARTRQASQAQQQQRLQHLRDSTIK